MTKTKWCVTQKTKSEFAVKINTGLEKCKPLAEGS